jgi:hypothetical protein
MTKVKAVIRHNKVAARKPTSLDTPNSTFPPTMLFKVAAYVSAPPNLEATIKVLLITIRESGDIKDRCFVR